MPPKKRRKNSSIVEKLIAEPYLYSFFQAVRLLERASVLDDRRTLKNPIAGFTPPSTETIRIHSHQSLVFHSAEIFSIAQKENSSQALQWQMFINFMGLTGPSGVLPHHYTELVLQRLKMKDKSMMRFLDLFNHRTVSLFYQSNLKYKLPLAYEQKKLNPPLVPNTDSHSKVLLSLIGLGTGNLSNRLSTKDESLIFYSGLLSQQVRSVSGLQQILQHHFNVPVEIQEFVGQWQDLIGDVLSKLPTKSQPKGCNAQLGKSAMLGSKGWFAQGKIHIIIKPQNKQQLNIFAPGTKSLKALNEIVRLYIGMEHDYDFIIRIKRAEIPDKPTLSSETPLILGWDTWLPERTRKHLKQDDDVDIFISANSAG